MRRLLWKEWYDLRWYLIGFLAGPWLVTRLGMLQKLLPREVYDLVFWVMAILLAFVAATRVSKDVRAEHMSVQWLPINRWVVWLTKYVPGLLVAVVLPMWMRWVVTVTYADPWAKGYTIDQGLGGPEVMSAIYACTFAASMFLPSMAAVLVGLLVEVVVGGYISYSLVGYAPANAFFAALAAVATTVSVGAWRRPAGATVRSRASSAGVGALLGLIPALCLGVLVAAHELGGLQAFIRNCDSYRAWQRSRQATFGRPWVCDGADDIVSADGRYVAHLTELWSNPGTRNRLVIVDAYGNQIEVPDPTAIPAAWMPNGRLLVYTGSMGREMVLNEFDPRAHRLTRLASFPPLRRDRTCAPIDGVFPDPSGHRLALALQPSVGSGQDIWALDLRTRSLRMLRPGVMLSGRFPQDFSWDDDALVVWRMGDYWRFPLDGSAPRRVTASMKEAPGD
jgi:hypothetical protein